MATRTAALPEHMRPALRRAARGKVVLAAAGIVAFAGAFGLARRSHASHPKRPAGALAAPGRFVGIVRRNELQAGIVAPAQAPPEAQTSVS
ncbi:MAG TPA: hypothetical protein VLA98_12585 [Solirubrobacteraceae bacterium]|nr:hypothetical protein [Solirubrobacteraceae bacterium]HSD81088.1 hypothetical protein [Solirubrobacteraceae bacterium]